jgi:ubiquinone/menaquinone biosynthesis C-methylase UbiE
MGSISFDRAASYYDATRGYPPEVADQIAKAIITTSGLASNKHLLEIGIGTGRIAFPILKQGYTITGIDISNAMMDQLRGKIQSYHSANPDALPLKLTLMQDDSTAMSFPDATFDIVLSVHVLHLIPNWKATIQEVLRVLKPGGIYLNGMDRNIRIQQKTDIMSIWEHVLQNLGQRVPNSPNPNRLALSQEINKEFESLGLSCEEIPTVCWQEQHTLRTFYNNIASRCWSQSWSIPDDIFALAFQQFDQTLAESEVQLDSPVISDRQFVLSMVKKI